MRRAPAWPRPYKIHPLALPAHVLALRRDEIPLAAEILEMMSGPFLGTHIPYEEVERPAIIGNLGSSILPLCRAKKGPIDSRRGLRGALGSEWRP
jgi:hypothetical protein